MVLGGGVNVTASINESSRFDMEEAVVLNADDIPENNSDDRASTYPSLVTGVLLTQK
jgi:hypothetical protein